MSSSRLTKPVYIHDIIVKADEPSEAATQQTKTVHMLGRFGWPSKRTDHTGSLKMLSARAQVKRRAELTDLYQRFRKHPEYDDYNGM